MKQVCIYCRRQSSAGDLWCTESNCATELKPLMLEYGESLADLTIKKLVTVLPSSIIYEATRLDHGQNTLVFLKVAHSGFEDRLRRESQFLATIANKGGHNMLPSILPAHPDANLLDFSYGKTMFKDKTLYYAIYEHEDGDILSGMLLKNPQPWYQHVGWIAISLADALEEMHRDGKLHLGLSPDAINIRFGETRDKKQVPIPMLLDLGMVCEHNDATPAMIEAITPTAYLAPEILAKEQIGRRTDVYGLGLITHEMLSGAPTFKDELVPNVVIRNNIIKQRYKALNRIDLQPSFVSLVRRSIQPYSKRHSTPAEFATEIMNTGFPIVPPEKPPRKFNWRNFAIVVGILLLITLLIATAAVIGEEISDESSDSIQGVVLLIAYKFNEKQLANREVGGNSGYV